MSASAWATLVLILFTLGVGGAFVWSLWRHRMLQAERAHLEQELEAVCTLAGMVSGTDWSSSMQNLVDYLVRQQMCSAALLYTLTENGNLEVRAACQGVGASVWEAQEFPGALQALGSRVPVQTEDGDLYLPIMEDGETIGLLALRAATIRMAALEVAVKLAALGLIGIKRHQKQVTLSNTDGLTGLATHRHFQQSLGLALGKAYLEGSPLSVILLDIDHFKAVNDTYGHLLGDLVLRDIAYLLRRGLPSDALAARYGGEEIVIILQSENARRAPEIAEQLRERVADHQFFDFASGTKLNVTISLGVATYELGQGKNRLIARADEALYASKREGRDRVTVAQPETSTTYPIPS